ncbi:MAG TPA: hypothetical protein VMZ26_11450, partial [Pyrinomonadaceae bacterium]|nr:hypothetical protein [Pyrinomonadaceae bacterium]
MMKLAVLLFILLLGTAGHIAAQSSTTRAEILILGTYHMANPGQDIFNMQADDVTSAKRQQEMA